MQKALERLACSCEGRAPLFQRQATSCAFRTSCVELAPHATPTRTITQHSYNPSSISSRCESDTAARFGCAAPPARRGRFRNLGAASVSSSSTGAPPPFRSLSSRRKDIAAPRSAAADDGRPKVSIVYPGLGGGRRGELFAFLRGFFAGRRDDGAAGAAGASREASVGGAGAAAPESV